MSSLSDLDLDGVEEVTQDKLWTKLPPLECGVYDVIVTQAFIDESPKGAKILNLSIKFDADDRKLTLPIYFTSGTAKGGLPYYVNSKGVKRMSVGFTIFNDLAEAICQKKVSELDTEMRGVSVWDYSSKSEVTKKREVITEFTGQKVALGILNTLEDHYETPTTSRKVVKIDKVFQAETLCTVVELAAGVKAGEFVNSWKVANEGGIQDNREQSKDFDDKATGSDSDPFEVTEEAVVDTADPFA